MATGFAAFFLRKCIIEGVGHVINALGGGQLG
jgi:hypothetical protein